MKQEFPRILGLDIGEKRLGVAITDPLGIFAQPLLSINIKNNSEFEGICDIISQYNVCTIVVGLPIELNGNHGPRVEFVKKFVAKLQRFINKKFIEKSAKIPEICYWDERLTTMQAEHFIKGAKLKNRQRKEALDRISAAVILESFLNCRKTTN